MWLALVAACCPFGGLVSEPPPPPPPIRAPVRIQPPQPHGALPASSDSRPEPPPSPISEESCDDLQEGGPVGGPGCLTAVIQCDQTVIGHTRGGVNLYTTEWYDDHQCTPGVTDHDGGDERVYRLDVPDGDYVAFVTLYTPCADLDVAAYLGTRDACPTDSAPLSRCEENRLSNHQMERLTLATQGEASWYIIVEGVKQNEGLFGLSVQCRPGSLF
jgi:hypothetical protein